MARPSDSTHPFDPMVFWVSAGVTVAFVLGSILFPDTMTAGINQVFTWTTTMWTWLYLITVFSWSSDALSSWVLLTVT